MKGSGARRPPSDHAGESREAARGPGGAGVPTSAERRTARLWVAGQAGLLALLVALPTGHRWPAPRWLQALCAAGAAAGVGVMVAGGTTLGRGLTAVPLPNRHAVLRTGGLYRHVRHPIYSGLLLSAGSVAVASGAGPRLAAFGGLVALLNGKARWEEQRLAEVFEDYPRYAAETPRFVPRPGRRRAAPTVSDASRPSP